MMDDLEANLEMMTWNHPRQAVHVVGEFAEADPIIREARTDDVVIIELGLEGVTDEDELLEILNRTFRFPFPTTNFNAAIDWISDLGWMPSAAGYLLVVRGLDHCPRDVAVTMSRTIPPILERWRTGGITFVAVLVSDTSRDAIAAALSAANDRLDEHAALPWTVNATGAVLVTYDR